MPFKCCGSKPSAAPKMTESQMKVRKAKCKSECQNFLENQGVPEPTISDLMKAIEVFAGAGREDRRTLRSFRNAVEAKKTVRFWIVYYRDVGDPTAAARLEGWLDTPALG